MCDTFINKFQPPKLYPIILQNNKTFQDSNFIQVLNIKT